MAANIQSQLNEEYAEMVFKKAEEMLGKGITESNLPAPFSKSKIFLNKEPSSYLIKFDLKDEMKGNTVYIGQ